jgi:hypothetical protein
MPAANATANASAASETAPQLTSNVFEVPADGWTEDQQVAFEKALTKFGAKMEKNERWKKIGEAVPRKTKKECVDRFKVLRAAAQIPPRADAEDVSVSSEVGPPCALFFHSPSKFPTFLSFKLPIAIYFCFFLQTADFYFLLCLPSPPPLIRQHYQGNHQYRCRH